MCVCVCIRELNFLPHFRNSRALPYGTSLVYKLLVQLLSFSWSRQTLDLLGTKKSSASAQKIVHLACSGLNENERVNDG